MEVGSQRGTAFGVVAPSVGEALWLAGTLQGLSRWSLGPRFGLVAAAGASAPLLRPEYVIDGPGPVFRAAAVSFRAGLGLEVYF